eukprot:jgi/Ulvmu1/12792/UM097_0019.1
MTLGKTKGCCSKATTQYPKSGDPAACLQLVSFPPMEGSKLSSTPFGGKVEAIMRLAGLKYEGYGGKVNDPKTAPKKKFPVLWHGGQAVPDSSAIVTYLFNTYPKQMAIFTPPTAQAGALATSLQRMLEEHTYFGVIFMLWQQDDVWSEYGPHVFEEVPYLLRGTVSSMVRSAIVRDIHGQGMGRHSMEEVKERMAKDLDACCALLEASGEYLTGGTPCQADCFLFALIDAAVGTYTHMQHVPGHVELLKARPALLDFHERLSRQLFEQDEKSCWKGTWDPKKLA